MLTAKEAKEQQAQFRSEEKLVGQYLEVIQYDINATVRLTDRNYIDYYGCFNELTKIKLIENGFKVETCQRFRENQVTIGVKISW